MDNLRIEQVSNLDNLQDFKNSDNVLILRCQKGNFNIRIESKVYSVTSSKSLFLAYSRTFKVLEQSENLSVTLYILSSDFFNDSTILFDDHVFKEVMSHTPDMISVKKLELANSFLDQISTIYNRGEYVYRRKILINLIQNYCIEIFEQVRLISKNQLHYATNYNKRIINDFHSNIWKHKNRDVEFYAKQLNISSRHLYTITKTTMQSTPKEVIDWVIIAFIKNLLLSSELTNQQIAEKFNFSDQSTFGQYFKRCEGISPSAFRNLNRTL